MFFDYDKRLSEIWARHLKEAPLLRQVIGITESDIKSILSLDNKEFHSDQKFYGDLAGYLIPEHSVIQDTRSIDAELDFMDQIEDERLHSALMSLKPIERKIVVLHVIDDVPLKKVAVTLDVPYNTVKNQYFRAKVKIKKYF